MTPAEHARNIRRTLRAVHRALHEHHEALAAAAREHGAAIGLGADVVAQAVPKDPPPNPD